VFTNENAMRVELVPQPIVAGMALLRHAMGSIRGFEAARNVII